MERIPRARFFFDYVDPLSYLLGLEIEEVLAGSDLPAPERVPLEVRPPPQPLLDLDAPWWKERWEAALTIAARRDDVVLEEPSILPWTRKAHELVAHAEACGVGGRAHRAVFEAFFVRGEDIGRIDVLVRVGQALGLDVTETKAVLDVDRYAQAAAERRDEAAAFATEPPLLALGGDILRGFHNRDAVRTFLLR